MNRTLVIVATNDTFALYFSLIFLTFVFFAGII